VQSAIGMSSPTNQHPVLFYSPSCHPTNSVKAPKGIRYQNVSILYFTGHGDYGVASGAIRYAKLQPNRYHPQTNTELLTGRTELNSDQRKVSNSGDMYASFEILLTRLLHQRN